jgi:16S rRNA (guanine966-N2)-methyltransferase
MPTKNEVRIIGGKWRSRKLRFPDLPELRPTPDRVRETLFNWLSPYVVGARCLDLFAGSGALGFEALSRGASSVVMVDQSAVVVQQLQANALLLAAEKEVVLSCSQVPNEQLLLDQNAFDIIFLDPPFHKNYLATCCEWLENANCLAKNALIYIEAESSLRPPLPIPKNWTLLREKKAGEVGYYLVTNQ